MTSPQSPLSPDDILPGSEVKIPTYRIDLGLPPEERYLELASDFSTKIRAVVPLFDEVLGCLPIPQKLQKVVKLASRLSLRKVYEKEQTKEIKSIARVAGVDLYLAIALNVFLDLLLGCTSGAILVRPNDAIGDNDGPSVSDRLMHFRTLEWGMDSLRSLLVSLEFVNSKTSNPGEVIARSITYAGFVGVLTGVRPNLSLSLNHRPYHDCRRTVILKHQLLVVLGVRESISSVLRHVLFSDENEDAPPTKEKETTEQLKTVSRIAATARRLASRTTSPCYVTLCDGKDVAIVLKDVPNGKVMTSSHFMIQTNHDAIHGSCCDAKDAARLSEPKCEIFARDEWLVESEQRLQALQFKWNGHVYVSSTENSAGRRLMSQNGTCLDSSGQKSGEKSIDQLLVPGITEERLLTWIREGPTTNEMTHFSCIMDPRTGEIRGLVRGPPDGPGTTSSSDNDN
ncbi:hypothetical protein CkaCkLH20_08640 [Colletotrichum karsti]|uniref:ceramidase n=1 Tax=Colletotrichum karsti TaxID=1095194 RepID=A0A9P6I4L9_9PEZI|nr:uncharacterized protein CkaCkLH20_08640 [Colletotrichum karsti]KAF9873906.1 hypothetical protein CkaCkLH20_08640 [Colletotrichum karsti]